MINVLSDVDRDRDRDSDKDETKTKYPENEFVFPNIEDVYDMETETLVIVKSKIEEKVNYNNDEENLNLDDSDNSIELNLFSISNFNIFNEKRLKKLYKFVVAELKERNSFEQVLNFFLDKNAYEKISSSLFNNDYISTKDNSNKEISSTNSNNNFDNYLSFNVHPHTENALVTNPIRPYKMDIKSLLQKTKLDDNFKFLIGQPTQERNIRKAPIRKNKTEDKEMRLTASKNMNRKASREPAIKISYNINLNINVKQKKKSKLNKIRNNSGVKFEDKTLTNLDMRRKYVVPDIKAFIRHSKSTTSIGFGLRVQKINENLNNNNKQENYNTRIDIEAIEKIKEIKVVNTDVNLVNIVDKYSDMQNKDLKIDYIKNIFDEKKSNIKNLDEENKSNIENLEIKKLDKENNNSKKTSLLISTTNLNKIDKICNQSLVQSPINQISYNIEENTSNISDKIFTFENENEDENKINAFSNKLSIQKTQEIDFCIIKSSPKNPNLNYQFDFAGQRENTNLPVVQIHLVNGFTNLNNNIQDYYLEYCVDNEGIQSERAVTQFTPIEKLITEQTYERKGMIDFSNLKKIVQRENTTKTTTTKTAKDDKSSINSTSLSKNDLGITKDNFFNKTANSSKSRITNFPSKKNTSATGSNFYSLKHGVINKDRKQSALALLKMRSNSSKMPLFKHINNNNNINSKNQFNSDAFKNIPDYSKLYKNFSEIFNGYFLSSEYNGKQFDLVAAMSTLHQSFKSLDSLENSDEGHMQKFERINSNVLEAEAEMIKNRLRQVSDKLLTDEDDLTGDRYYVYKKILELQKKEYGKRRERINQNNNNNNNNSETTNEIIINPNKMYFRVVLSRPEIYDILCYTLGLREDWRELPHGMLLGQCWNLLWTYSVPNIDMTKVFSFQKVNHLANNRVLARKDLLKKSLDRVRKLNQKLHKLFDIMPTTFILSKDYADFVDEFTRSKNSGINPAHNLWIVKPVAKSRGRGIFIINDISEVPVAESFLVQRYLTNPLLIDGYKFDLRIYVLVTSVNPLEAFLYKDGFARISNLPFSLNNQSRLVHLTNAAVQNKHAYSKRHENYEKMYGGCKISLEMLKNKLIGKGIDFEGKIWTQVREIVTKSLVACQYEIPFSPSAFELFGYDIIIDQNLDCWLLEVNSSPSLERSNVLDDQIKLQLVDDALNLVDPINFDRKNLLEVLERRMNMNNPTGSNNNSVYLYSPTIQLNLDLNHIFKGKVPRAYGEIPEVMGHFERISPTDESLKLIKLTGGQKLYGNKSKL